MLPTTPYRIAFNEDRTRDLALTKRMLCQLSYEGETRAKQINSYNDQPNFFCKPKSKKRCHHPESHRGYRRHKPGYCSYTIAAVGGSGYRSRFSTLRRLYATMYNNPPHASTGTRTRILTLEGLNTTLVLWTHDDGRDHLHVSGTRHVQKKKLSDINRIRTDEGIAH